MLRNVRSLPDGLVKAELIKSLAQIEKMLDGEMEASKRAWEIEPVLELIEMSGVKVQNASDSLVLLAHCVLQESGLISLGKRSSDDDLVPLDWNTSKDGLYILKYKMINPSHEEEAPDDVVILKVLRIGTTLSLNLIHERTGESKSLEIRIGDYVSGDYVLRVDGVEMLRRLCREKLLNDDAKEKRKKAKKNSTSSSSSNSTSTTPPSFPPPSQRRPRPQFNNGGIFRPGHGDFDRDLRPHFGGGFDGPRFGGGGGRGGSLMGPDHPIFGGSGNRQTGPRFPGQLPGARFDPYGPGVGPRGIPRPRRDFRPRPGPSPDHLPPPRFSDEEDDGPPSSMFF